MSNIHAGPVRVHTPGACRWAHHFEDVDLRCDETAIPLGELCAAHEIEKAALKHLAAVQVAHDGQDVTG